MNSSVGEQDDVAATKKVAYAAKNNCAIPQSEAGMFGYSNVHKLIPHKETGAWRRRGLIYQPVTAMKNGVKSVQQCESDEST